MRAKSPARQRPAPLRAPDAVFIRSKPIAGRNCIVAKGDVVIIRAPHGFWVGKLLGSIVSVTKTVIVQWYEEVGGNKYRMTQGKDRISVECIHPAPISLHGKGGVFSIVRTPEIDAVISIYGKDGRK